MRTEENKIKKLKNPKLRKRLKNQENEIRSHLQSLKQKPNSQNWWFEIGRPTLT